MKQLEEIVFAAILFVVFAVFVGVGSGMPSRLRLRS